MQKTTQLVCIYKLFINLIVKLNFVIICEILENTGFLRRATHGIRTHDLLITNELLYQLS